MFDDGGWDDSRTDAQRIRLRHWLAPLRACRLVVIECGAKPAIATVHLACEELADRFQWTLARINPREPKVSAGHMALPFGALKALRAIDGRFKPNAGTPVGVTD